MKRKFKLPVNTGCREKKEIKMRMKEMGSTKEKKAITGKHLGNLFICGLPADSSLTSRGSVERCRETGETERERQRVRERETGIERGVGGRELSSTAPPAV